MVHYRSLVFFASWVGECLAGHISAQEIGQGQIYLAPLDIMKQLISHPL